MIHGVMQKITVAQFFFETRCILYIKPPTAEPCRYLPTLFRSACSNSVQWWYVAFAPSFAAVPDIYYHNSTLQIIHFKENLTERKKQLPVCHQTTENMSIIMYFCKTNCSNL